MIKHLLSKSCSYLLFKQMRNEIIHVTTCTWGKNPRLRPLIITFMIMGHWFLGTSIGSKRFLAFQQHME